MILRQRVEGAGVVPDFGRGSREQSQGLTRPDNVHPIRRLAEAVPAEG